MNLPAPIEIDDLQYIAREIVEVARTIIILRIAIAAGIPGPRLEARREYIELVIPVFLAAADTMKKQQQWSFAGMFDGDLRRRADQIQSVWRCGHAFSPKRN